MTLLKFESKKAITTIRWLGLLFLTLATCPSPASADYDCVCNYMVEAKVFQSPDVTSKVIGYMYEFDCKPAIGGEKDGFHAIMDTHMTGYVASASDITAQLCPGDIPDADKLTTTTAATSTTSPKPTTTTMKQTTTAPKITTTATRRTVTVTMTTTQKPPTTSTTTTTTPKPITTTTVKTTTKPTPPATTITDKTTTRVSTTTAKSTSTAKPMKAPEGHVELCPNSTRNDIRYNGGFLGQYGEFCYEYVPYKTQWKNAERHCALVSSGHLTHIEDRLEQDFVLRFLRAYNHTDPIWIGLTDSDAEGTWQWSSGVPVGFKNFTEGYTQHTDRDHMLNDCVVLESSGSWLDLPCGVQLVLGTGFGESHSYVCQYNLTSKPPGIFEGFLPGFVVG